MRRVAAVANMPTNSKSRNETSVMPSGMSLGGLMTLSLVRRGDDVSRSRRGASVGALGDVWQLTSLLYVSTPACSAAVSAVGEHEASRACSATGAESSGDGEPIEHSGSASQSSAAGVCCPEAGCVVTVGWHHHSGGVQGVAAVADPGGGC